MRQLTISGTDKEHPGRQPDEKSKLKQTLSSNKESHHFVLFAATPPIKSEKEKVPSPSQARRGIVMKQVL